MRGVELAESNSGELVTQDPYHRHSGLIGVMAVITRRFQLGLFVLKSDEKNVRPPGLSLHMIVVCRFEPGLEAWEASVLTRLDYGR